MKKLAFPWGQTASDQRRWLARALRDETVGGGLLLVAALAAIVLANSPLKDSFFELRDFKIGPAAMHLNLSLATWAADGLLAVFFFTAGIELKHEFVHGSLKERSQALVPIFAAIGGMVIPAAIFMSLNFGQEFAVGWGVPIATDIAFALAILAVVGRHLPIELRAFLLTLAVVDDLGAVLVIAVFYSTKFAIGPLLVAGLLLLIFALLQKRRVRGWYVYLPLALSIWYFVHESGVHATIAGIAMGLLMNMQRGSTEKDSIGDSVLHSIHPYSSGFAVPVFAFFAAGVNIQDFDIAGMLASPLAMGILLGLVVGKPIGVFVGAFLAAKLSRAKLSTGISWWDIAAIGSLAGVGFTVSLLISELAFKGSPEAADIATLAVLGASIISAGIASALIWSRRRIYMKARVD